MEVRSLEAVFGFKFDVAVKFDESKAQQAHRQIENFSSTAQKALGVLAGYLGISTNALEEMRYAAQKSGVSLDTLDDSLRELQIRAVDAKSGTGEAAGAFK